VGRKKIAPRRAPKQERGQQRVGRILDAAAQEFARAGYEAATTNAIARRARTSVGSLYQFFPNKEAILYALADRYLAELRAVHERVLGAQANRLPLAVFYDRLVEGIAEYHRSQPGFRTLFYGSTTSQHLAAAARQLHQECIGRAERAIAARLPALPPEEVRLYAAINVEVIKSLLPLAEAGDEASRARLLAEIKKLLLTYMSRVERDVTGRTA
jgi:AcrR family transcriptional regulator